MLIEANEKLELFLE